MSYQGPEERVLDQVKGDKSYCQATKDILTDKLKPGVELLAQFEKMRRENEALKKGHELSKIC